jgi:hypothetical protein
MQAISTRNQSLKTTVKSVFEAIAQKETFHQFGKNTIIKIIRVTKSKDVRFLFSFKSTHQTKPTRIVRYTVRKTRNLFITETSPPSSICYYQNRGRIKTNKKYEAGVKNSCGSVPPCCCPRNSGSGAATSWLVGAQHHLKAHYHSLQHTSLYSASAVTSSRQPWCPRSLSRRRSPSRCPPRHRAPAWRSERNDAPPVRRLIATALHEAPMKRSLTRSAPWRTTPSHLTAHDTAHSARWPPAATSSPRVAKRTLRRPACLTSIASCCKTFFGLALLGSLAVFAAVCLRRWWWARRSNHSKMKVLDIV